jgi:hypothetical protein
MSSHATISAALLAAFNLDTDEADPAAVADAAASVLVAFADLVRAPAPVSYFSGDELKFATAELAADETPTLILAELRKQTTLLEVLAKQGDVSMRGAALLSTVVGAGPGGAHNSGLPG